jgi:ribose 5-phosphate isomerase B
MHIAMAADHGGFQLKECLRRQLAELGYTVEDLGTSSTASCDYPLFAAAVAHEVASGHAERGVLICTTGTGMAISANKVNGVRAAAVTNLDMTRMARLHNDANVIALGSRYVDEKLALELVRTFLETGFEGGRHQRRVDEISQLESVKKED